VEEAFEDARGTSGERREGRDESEESCDSFDSFHSALESVGKADVATQTEDYNTSCRIM
jgi:hypothetical protein